MLKNLQNIKFTTKLFVAVVIITVVSILITSGNAIRMADNGLYSLGQRALQDGHQAVYNALVMCDQNLRKKLDGDLLFFEKELKSKGEIVLDGENPRQETLVNQVTKQAISQKIPEMKSGSGAINGTFDIVDTITSISGASATIFQLVDDKLLRISTTVKKADGQRATGTYIPSDSPVYKAILSGETFRGKAFVVNDWYLAAYSPIRDPGGKIVGALYVGQLILNPQVREFITRTKVGGVGY
ncbi:MAG: hypothetical protein ACD_75C02252G0004 [uncultured bacterium]|nr:MAG: hypothetical protein ACD_75C02252G0004 [uncultured bacterium]